MRDSGRAERAELPLRPNFFPTRGFGKGRMGGAAAPACRLAIGLALGLGLVTPLHFALGASSPGQEDLRVGAATIHIDFSGALPLPRPMIVEWARRAAVAVTNYLGRFPVAELRLNIHGGGYDPVSDGVTLGNRQIDVRLGPHAKETDLNEDWILTHEMFHLAFPTLPRRYSWMMEGLSDYLEPIARGRAGQLSDAAVWREFVEGLPQGLPAAGDRGLAYDDTRERIYWGGNLYWLLADVKIRVETNNRHSVDDAIRGILNDGGDGGAKWSLAKVLKAGGKATKTTVLKDLYKKLGLNPGAVDLDNLWKNLGVKYKNGTITFDDNAPWAAARLAITARR
ncbi:MAG: hypothetical protein ACLQVY_19045 [Limisphaerales bacterium]